MRLYLSSYRVGSRPEELLALLHQGNRTALISNALDHVSSEDRAGSVGEQTEMLKQIGLDPTELDLRQWFGQQDGLLDALRGFDLVWARGGNTFILRRALRQSGGDLALKSLLAEDALAYAGYSAGACVLSPSLRGLELVDYPDRIPDGYDPPVLWDGLGLVPYAIAPHYQSDHAEAAAIDRVVAWYVENQVPFVALRDGEAIVVEDAHSRIVNQEGDVQIIMQT